MVLLAFSPSCFFFFLVVVVVVFTLPGHVYK